MKAFVQILTLFDPALSIVPAQTMQIYFVLANIGVAPITQPTHVRNKNSNIQGRSLNVVKVNIIRNCS